MRIYCIFFLLGFSFLGKAVAQTNPFQRVDSIMFAKHWKVKQVDDLKDVISFIVQNFKTDSDKVRASVDWIAGNIEYDVESFQKDNSKAADINYVLKHKRGICSGYASLFKYFCDALDIECRIVEGRARAFESDVYISQSNLYPNHAWNVVKVNGEFKLVDPTWIAGYCDDPSKNNMKFYRKFQEAYFFTPPEKFILNHYPKQSQYQLLKSPVLDKDFKKSPLYTTAFVEDSIKAISPDTSLIRLNIGDTLKIRLKTDGPIFQMMAWSTNEKTFYSDFTERKGEWVEFKYPIKVTGYYNLYVGISDGVKGVAIVAYKLRVDPKNDK